MRILGVSSLGPVAELDLSPPSWEITALLEVGCRLTSLKMKMYFHSHT